jgi:hypothetical protein
MNFTKEMGMTINLSIELRDENFEDSIKICNDVVKLYPMIDCLELITQECGAWETDESVTGAEVGNLIAELFGREAVDNEIICSNIRDGMWQLPTTLRELSNHIKVSESLGNSWKSSGYPDLMLGIYTTDGHSLKILLELIRLYAPAGIKLSFLPAHGSKGVVDSIKTMGFSAEDLKRTMIYSWIEFDGSMFLQQNSITGLEQLFQYYENLPDSKDYYGVAFNHWRSTENRTAIRYLSLACLYGPIRQDEFYKAYGRILGIETPEEYKEAMQKIDAVDSFVIKKLGNIGFCHEPVWLGPAGLGPAGRYSARDLDWVKNEYSNISELLDKCRFQSDKNAENDYVDFIRNRIECSKQLVEILLILGELKTLFEDIQTSCIVPEDRIKADCICDRAMFHAREYIETHAKMLPDRGCEGTLISFYYTLPVYILKLKVRFGTANPDEIYQARIGTDMGPPPPAI